MGYDASVYLIFGIRLPLTRKDDGFWDYTEVERIVRLFHPNIPKEEEHFDHWDEWLNDTICSGIRLLPNFPYEVKCFNNCGNDAAAFIVLDAVRMEVVRSSDPPMEVQLPSAEEIQLFTNTMAKYGVNYPYSQFMVIDGGC